MDGTTQYSPPGSSDPGAAGARAAGARARAADGIAVCAYVCNPDDDTAVIVRNGNVFIPLCDMHQRINHVEALTTKVRPVVQI